MSNLWLDPITGNYIDDSGAVASNQPGVQAEPASTDPLKPTGHEIETSGLDAVKGIANQLSWGFNAALFALPDAVTRTFGRMMGLDDKDVVTLTKIFNVGETAPRNSGERLSRALGQGAGGGLPLTGFVAYAALGQTGRVVSTSSAIRNIANDVVAYAAKNPGWAAGLDVAFNAAYEGMRQSVEEQVDDSNPNKALYKELMPMAAFVGGPLALSLMPSAQIAKLGGKGFDKLRSWVSGLPDVEAGVKADLPAFWKLPGVSIVPKVLMRRAEGKLEKVFGPIVDSPEAQQALKMLEESLLDPRIAQAGFIFDAAEQTQFAPLVQARKAILEGLGPKELQSTLERIQSNQMKLKGVFDSFAPEDQKGLAQAFMELQQERDTMFKGILQQKKDLSQAELARLSEIYGPLNMDQINDELRGVILSQMEMDGAARKRIMNKLGMQQALAEDGTLLSTRSDGRSLYPAVDMEKAAMSLIEKYRPDRPSLRVKVPEPIRLLEDFVKTQQLQRQKLESGYTQSYIDDVLRTYQEESGMKLDKDFASQIRKWMEAAVNNTSMEAASAAGKKTPRGKISTKDLGAIIKPDKDGSITIPTGFPGKPLRFNPQTLKEDVERMAREETAININLPEGLDYLESAMKFRNSSIVDYNSAVRNGRSRLTDAQKLLDQGDAVVKDFEKLVLDHVPQINKKYSDLKTIVDDYRNVYETNMSLLATAKTPRAGGMEYLVPNEAVMANAFKSADNLRKLTALISGPSDLDARAMDLFKQGAYDWLRTKKIFTKEGLIDPAKINRVLIDNKNIIDALPKGVRESLLDEAKIADDIVTRMGVLNQRETAAKNAELDKLISKALKEDADPVQFLQHALTNPAEMRQLVNAFKGNPDNLAALRRSVFDIASGGSAQGASLQNFLKNNEKSMKILFTEQHLKDLNMLADIQKRVMTFADITGKMPEFNSLDQSLKNVFGAGIQYATTTMREAMVGRIRPGTGFLALGLRLIGTTENKIYNSIFTKALEDASFANRLVHVSTPAQGQKLAADLQQIGINVPKMMLNLAIVKNKLSPAALNQMPVPEKKTYKQEGSTAQRMLRTLPPAPKLGMEQVLSTPFNTAPPAPPGGNLLYPQLFPNDPLSSMLQQRAAGQNPMMQPPQQ